MFANKLTRMRDCTIPLRAPVSATEIKNPSTARKRYPTKLPELSQSVVARLSKGAREACLFTTPRGGTKGPAQRLHYRGAEVAASLTTPAGLHRIAELVPPAACRRSALVHCSRRRRRRRTAHQTPRSARAPAPGPPGTQR